MKAQASTGRWSAGARLPDVLWTCVTAKTALVWLVGNSTLQIIPSQQDLHSCYQRKRRRKEQVNKGKKREGSNEEKQKPSSALRTELFFYLLWVYKILFQFKNFLKYGIQEKNAILFFKCLRLSKHYEFENVPFSYQIDKDFQNVHEPGSVTW